MIEPRFDETIHSHHRLQICAILADVDAIDFATVPESLNISESCLSKHIKYLGDAKYHRATKKPHGIRTRTWLSVTETGRTAYEGHLAELRRIVEAPLNP